MLRPAGSIVVVDLSFYDCAARVLTRERAESVLAGVQTLETVPNVSVPARLLSGSAG
ncbi:MAG TPA: hypothetical protein VET45_08360 [Candidatus Binatia bacterium]|nr:hypothetical protein [Candidatus Binatia bacterium]